MVLGPFSQRRRKSWRLLYSPTSARNEITREANAPRARHWSSSSMPAFVFRENFDIVKQVTDTAPLDSLFPWRRIKAITPSPESDWNIYIYKLKKRRRTWERKEGCTLKWRRSIRKFNSRTRVYMLDICQAASHFCTGAGALFSLSLSLSAGRRCRVSAWVAVPLLLLLLLLDDVSRLEGSTRSTHFSPPSRIRCFSVDPPP